MIPEHLKTCSKWMRQTVQMKRWSFGARAVESVFMLPRHCPRQLLLPVLVAILGSLPLTSSSLAAATEISDPVEAITLATREAEQGLQIGELEIAESRYRTVLLEGWLLIGALAVEAGDLEAARAAFELASVSAVETRRARMSLALVEIQLGNPKEAVSLLRDLKKDDLSDAVVRRLIPRALMAADQVEEAIQEMEELHVLNPTDLENTYALARTYLGQGRVEEAEPLLAELAEKRPSPETRVLIGRTYRDFEHWQRARAELQAALEQEPGIGRAHYYLGSIDLLDQGQDLLEKAMGHFEAELKVAPEDPLTNLYLGIALAEQRRYEEAVPRLEIATRLVTDRADAFQFLGRSYLALGRIDESVAALRRGLEIAETAPEPVMARGAVDFRRRQISSLHFQLAQALRRAGESEEAQIHFDAAKEFSARSAEGARDLLEAYFRDEDDERNLASATWPLELSPVSGVGPQQRVGIELGVKSSLAQVYFNLGVLQAKAGQFERAAALYWQAVELDPDFPRLQYSLGTALFNSERYEEATAPLIRAREGDPGEETLRRMLALAWFNSESYDKAADLLHDDPGRASNPSLQYTYAVALVRSGRADEAEPVFDTLLAENADWPELNVLLGQAHAQDNDYDEAIRYLRRALDLKTDVAEAQETLGDIYLRQGKLAEAEDALRAELNSHPDNGRAQYTLAVVLDLNRKPEEALGVLRPLLEAKPDLADGRYLMGKILLAQGAAEEARAQLEAAAELAPEDANIHYQLGQAYQRLGLREKARGAFEVYRRLKKDSRDGERS